MAKKNSIFFVKRFDVMLGTTSAAPYVTTQSPRNASTAPYVSTPNSNPLKSSALALQNTARWQNAGPVSWQHGAKAQGSCDMRSASSPGTCINRLKSIKDTIQSQRAAKAAAARWISPFQFLNATKKTKNSIERRIDILNQRFSALSGHEQNDFISRFSGQITDITDAYARFNKIASGDHQVRRQLNSEVNDALKLLNDILFGLKGSTTMTSVQSNERLFGDLYQKINKNVSYLSNQAASVSANNNRPANSWGRLTVDERLAVAGAVAESEAAGAVAEAAGALAEAESAGAVAEAAEMVFRCVTGCFGLLGALAGGS